MFNNSEQSFLPLKVISNYCSLFGARISLNQTESNRVAMNAQLKRRFQHGTLQFAALSVSSLMQRSTLCFKITEIKRGAKSILNLRKHTKPKIYFTKKRLAATPSPSRLINEHAKAFSFCYVFFVSPKPRDCYLSWAWQTWPIIVYTIVRQL